MTKKEQMTLEEAYRIVHEHENKLYWDGLNKELDTYLEQYPEGSTVEVDNIEKSKDMETLLKQRGYRTYSWWDWQNISVMLKFSKKKSKKKERSSKSKKKERPSKSKKKERSSK